MRVDCGLIREMANALHICLPQPFAGRPLGGTAAEALRAIHLPYLSRGYRPIGCVRPARIASHNGLTAKEARARAGYQTRQDFSGYMGLPLAH